MDLVEASGKTVISRHPWEQARLSVLKKLISKHVSLSGRSTVLDIGCGDTYVVENLAITYPDTIFYAVDTAFTPELIEKYRKNLKVKNVQLFQTLDELPEMKREKATLVVLTDVIEHIEDDKKFLTELNRRTVIDDKTLFLITVPAYQSLFCSHDTFLGHYRRYTNGLLKKNLIESGMKIISVGYFFASLLPLRTLQVLKEKIGGMDRKQISTGLVQWEGGNSLEGIFRQFLITDANLSFFLKRLGINFPGLSNYAICRRSA